MEKYILITTTFKDKSEAEKIIEILVKNRLVSCCQTQQITSTYHWQGKIEKEDEYFVQMKTKKSLYTEIENIILENHSYITPQIVYYEINGGYKNYLDWIGQETI